jgi:hypothetical protein
VRNSFSTIKVLHEVDLSMAAGRPSGCVPRVTRPSWAAIFPGLSGAAFLLRMLALCIEGLISKK